MEPITKNTSENDVLSLTKSCNCNSCKNGCRYGSGTLTDDQIPKLSDYLNITEDVLKKEFLEEVERFNTKKLRPKIIKKEKPFGKCIFFDEEIGCKIHDVKPLECKVAMECKDYGEKLTIWFMLNHFINKDDPESVRQFATYLKSGGKTLPGGDLKNLIPDNEKLKKILAYKILN